MIGARLVRRMPLIVSSAIVVKTSGWRGPFIAASRISTALRASAMEVMNGMRWRSKTRSGNCTRRALPIASALMPVCSATK